MGRRSCRSRAVGGWQSLAMGIGFTLLAIMAAQADEAKPGAESPEALQLDLRLGDLRRFVDPQELDTPLPEQLDDVTIWAHPETPDMVETRPVPGGLAGIFWAAWHPTQLWRLFVPDPNLRMPEEDTRP